ISGSWHLDLSGNFPTFSGWVLPFKKDILVVSEDHHKAMESLLWARRVGIDRIIGYLDGGMVAWAIAGFRTGFTRQISAFDLHEMTGGKSNLVLLDVRSTTEYEDNHIKGAVNIPVADLRTRYKELNKDKPTIIICSSGNRSSLATSILSRNGFTDLYNVAGGMTGYSAAGYTKQCKMCENPHGSRFFSEYSDQVKHWD
ncbi:MAG: rhodanese-like domain-containing protein, partial [Bacteroidales bacterium]|nr:rhodanese-like domain-containing protein [Bacteroidales bacterium]